MELLNEMVKKYELPSVNKAARIAVCRCPYPAFVSVYACAYFSSLSVNSMHGLIQHHDYRYSTI